MPKPAGSPQAPSWILHISKIAVACFLVLGSLQALTILLQQVRPEGGLTSDLVEYWATGKLLRAHENPYDLSRMYQVERLEGVDEDSARFNFGPPVALPLWLVLGSMSARMARLVWYAAQLLCLYASARILRSIYGKDLGPLPWMVFLFAPVLLCERAGQLGIFILLAVLLFLVSYRQRPFLAGACLAPMILKPHIFLPFACVLVVWIVFEGRWKIVFGFLVAVGLSLGLSVWLDPHCWQQYRDMMAHAGTIDFPLPCLSSYMRRLLRARVAVQFLPSAVACLLAIGYYLKKRRSWSWENNGVLLLALGPVTAPYSWVMDECIAAPALLSRLVRCRSSWPCLGALAFLNAVAIVEGIRNVPVQSAGYLWTAPAWLIWCIVVDLLPEEKEQPVAVLAEG